MSTGERVIVVGAGAGGLMAAGRAAERGATVLLLEKTDRPGKKLLIAGGGRSNVTNTRPLQAFLEMYGPNGQFLRNAFHRFFRDELLVLLARHGVATQAEADGKVFPASNSARDVVAALERYAGVWRSRPRPRTDGPRGRGRPPVAGAAELRTRMRVTGLLVEGGRVCGVRTAAGPLPGAAVVLATGGASYPGTGSSGDGCAMAAAVGHTIVPLRPALVPLVVREAALAKRMQGVSLPDVRLTVWQCSADRIDPALTPGREIGRGLGRPRPRVGVPVIESRRGSLVFTHNGLGGPVTLLVSLAAADALAGGPVSISIDLRPDLDPAAFTRFLQAHFRRHQRRSFRAILWELLPRKMVDPVVEMTGIPPGRLGCQVTADERRRLAALVKALRFSVVGPLSMAAAIVTAGGVSLREIDPQTMASRRVAGLFLCGEVMDLDADTGGYNLQAAFSTGHVAGESAADLVLKV